MHQRRSLQGMFLAFGAHEVAGQGAQLVIEKRHQRMVASLWRVDDASAAELMSAFYQRLATGEGETLAAFNAARKALRKAVHKLRSRGIALPESPASEPVVARLPRIEDDFESAFVSALDPRGARLVYLAESNPSGGARMFEILLDEHRGIVDFQVYSAGRSRIRRSAWACRRCPRGRSRRRSRTARADRGSGRARTRTRPADPAGTSGTAGTPRRRR